MAKASNTTEKTETTKTVKIRFFQDYGMKTCPDTKMKIPAGTFEYVKEFELKKTTRIQPIIHGAINRILDIAQAQKNLPSNRRLIKTTRNIEFTISIDGKTKFCSPKAVDNRIIVSENVRSMQPITIRTPEKFRSLMIAMIENIKVFQKDTLDLQASHEVEVKKVATAVEAN